VLPQPYIRGMLRQASKRAYCIHFPVTVTKLFALVIGRFFKGF